MKQLIQKFGLVVAALLSFLSASAYDFELDGIYYTIISPADLTCGVTYGDNKYVGDIAIPSEVTFKGRTLSVISVREDAFYGCSGLTSVVIPNSVTEIGSSAFYGCSGLTSVVIPNSVTSIGFGAFEECSGLTSVVIPNSVTSIESSAFEECSGLTSVVISNSVTTIDYQAFSGCSGLTSVVIPNSVTSISDEAFKDCSGLTSVVIPNSVTSIGDCAFNDCSGLTSVVIPNSVTTIYYGAFSGCSSLNKLIILGNDNNSGLKFKYCGGSDYYYPRGFSALEELYLGRIVNVNEGVEYPSLSTIKKITFGKYLKKVGSGVFRYIDEIPTTAEIYCENPTPPSFDREFTTQQYISNVVYVPEEALEAYKQAEGWKNFWDIRAYDFESAESEIKDVSVDDISADVFKIYNLSGQLVKVTTDKTDACDLPAGIYIINGRKVAIK